MAPWRRGIVAFLFIGTRVVGRHSDAELGFVIAVGTSPLLKRQRCVALCRLHDDTNFGPGAERTKFVCFVFVHPVEKQTKTAVEVSEGKALVISIFIYFTIY